MEIFVEKRRRAEVFTFDPALPWDGPGTIYKAPHTDEYILVDSRNNIPKPIAPGMVVKVQGIRVEIMTRAVLEAGWEPEPPAPAPDRVT